MFQWTYLVILPSAQNFFCPQVSDCAGGWDFSIILLQDGGGVLAAGSNKFNQLGTPIFLSYIAEGVGGGGSSKYVPTIYVLFSHNLPFKRIM